MDRPIRAADRRGSGPFRIVKRNESVQALVVAQAFSLQKTMDRLGSMPFRIVHGAPSVSTANHQPTWDNKADFASEAREKTPKTRPKNIEKPTEVT